MVISRPKILLVIVAALVIGGCSPSPSGDHARIDALKQRIASLQDSVALLRQQLNQHAAVAREVRVENERSAAVAYVCDHLYLHQYLIANVPLLRSSCSKGSAIYQRGSDQLRWGVSPNVWVLIAWGVFAIMYWGFWLFVVSQCVNWFLSHSVWRAVGSWLYSLRTAGDDSEERLARANEQHEKAQEILASVVSAEDLLASERARVEADRREMEVERANFERERKQLEQLKALVDSSRDL